MTNCSVYIKELSPQGRQPGLSPTVRPHSTAPTGTFGQKEREREGSLWCDDVCGELLSVRTVCQREVEVKRSNKKNPQRNQQKKTEHQKRRSGLTWAGGPLCGKGSQWSTGWEWGECWERTLCSNADTSSDHRWTPWARKIISHMQRLPKVIIPMDITLHITRNAEILYWDFK